MAYYLSPVVNDSQTSTSGAPLNGGLVYAYAAGTTTPQATYTDSTGGTPQANPIVLNVYGLPPSPVWLTGGQAYKFVIKDTLGNTIRTIDNVSGINDPAFVWPVGVFPPVGQCRLAKSGANLVLSPYAGNKLPISGVLYAIPSAGVTLTPTGTVANTVYYIYAFINATVMTLEFSTTGYVTDSTTGVTVKSGDPSRTLVGMAGAGVSNNTWTTAALCVLSYFNRQRKSDKGSFTTARVNSSTYPTYLETNSEIRVSFLVWADTLARADFSGYVSNASLGGVCYSNIGFDNTGATAEDGGSVFTAYTAAVSGSPYCYALKSGLSEATIHYATQLGSAATGNATYAGGATPVSRCVLQVSLDG